LLYGDGDHNFAHSAAPALACLDASEETFIDLNIALQALAASTYHRSPKAVKHRPYCLVAAKTKNSF
jgi:hypothetical protein